MSAERGVRRDDNQPRGPVVHGARVGSGPWREDAHAVVIGINEYADPQIRNLTYARADAEAMHSVLTDPDVGRYRPENVELLVDAAATQRGIMKAISTRLRNRCQEDHTVCVYFAGHGAPLPDPTGGAADGIEKFLLPHDAEADDLRVSAIRMELIREWFGLLRARQVVFFLDSCYSGAGGRSVSPPGFQTRAALDDRFLESLGSEGRLVVTACKANEVSLEADRLGHGVFTHFLVEGLRGAADREGGNGDGLVSMDELYDYLHRKVRHEAQSLGGLMQPMRSGSVAGTVYLTQYETGQQKQARVASAAALVAWERGEVDEAVRLWTEVVALDPGHEGARGGLAAFGELRARESAAREEEARARAAERARDERVLFELVNTQALTFEEYDRAVHLLQEAPDSLSETDRKRRRFLDARMNLSLSLSLSLSLANARSAGDGVVKAPHAARGRRAYVVRAFLERRDVHTIPQRWASSWVA